MKPTLIFDFDSTLIAIESLEAVLKNNCTPEQLEEIEQLTMAGMEGQLSFRDSLEKRLHIAKPTLQGLQNFVHEAESHFTEGMPRLIEALHEHYDIWIISGGFQELITPVAAHLGIQQDHVIAVSGVWDDNGDFIELDTNNPSCNGKVEAAKAVSGKWHHPVTIVGDGATDYALFEAGVADRFIAYTEHAKRGFLENIDCQQVNTAKCLMKILNIKQ